MTEAAGREEIPDQVGDDGRIVGDDEREGRGMTKEPGSSSARRFGIQIIFIKFATILHKFIEKFGVYSKFLALYVYEII